MLRTSARVLRLLSLLQARRFWSGKDLAERLEVTERTVRRDVDRLRSLGYPVDATCGVAGGYQLGAGATLPPLLLEDDEALAVAVGLRTAAGGTVVGMEEAAVRALAKLERVLPSRLRREVNALQAAFVPFAPLGPTIDATLLATLAAACRDRERLAFTYESGRAHSSQRLVEPQGLAHTGYRWYLVAWDVDRDDWRTFRVDRMRGKPSLGPRFMPRPSPDGGDLRAYLQRSLAVRPYPTQARVILHAPLQDVMKRISPTAGVLERIDDERTLLCLGAHSADRLALWIADIGVDFEVQDPPELIESLRSLRARFESALARSITRSSSA